MRAFYDTADRANEATEDSSIPLQEDHPTRRGSSSGDGDAHGPPSGVTDRSNDQQVQHAFEHGDDGSELERPQGHGELDELEIDDQDDSALGSETETITRSLDSTVYYYREEYGRTYHGYRDGKYYLPNDEPESDRLDFMHEAFRQTYGLFLSPVTKLENALDIGTGTGIWAMDLAEAHPECQIIGTDLSPSQPNFVPPNVQFMVDDAEDYWVFTNKFDLIHARLMAGSFADWPKFFREAYRNLEPGGWLELQEYVMPVNSKDGTHKNTNILKWGQLLCEASRNLGRPMGSDVCDLFPQQMRDAGFVDVQQRDFAWPTNTWPKNPLMKELGLRTLINCTDGMEGFCLALLTRGLGWTKEEVDVFVALVKKDFKDRSIHAYIPMPVIYGRKPFSAWDYDGTEDIMEVRV